MKTNINQYIETNLLGINSPEKVYELFETLGYQILDSKYKGKEAWTLPEKEKNTIKEIYTICNYSKRFQISLIELETLSPSTIKNISLFLEKEIQYPLFIFTDDYRNFVFVLIEKIREDVGVWKQKLVRLHFDRENAYYTDRFTICQMYNEQKTDDPVHLYQIFKEALSIEKVSRLFFEDYKNIFFALRENLTTQNIDIKKAHEFSQQLLNRIMFIYFVDRKMWFRHSPKFMKWFWTRYKQERKKGIPENLFYEKWLEVLFLEAFNNQFSHPAYLPQDVKDALSLAPFLNGGLFKITPLDELQVNLDDAFLENILAFFEKYNFTIREDLPLDVEVAIDPQMLGYVYESLANVAEEIYERQDLGIFYTPKIEVDFMCRRSLIEYLGKTTKFSKDLLYHLLFDEDKMKIEKQFQSQDYETLEESLDNLSILDPACGSGAFLVGILNILVELYKFDYKHLKREMTDYQLKKRIIGNSLYGVDIMPWAVHSAELRLWLSLMIESDLTLAELKITPLLPNLNLKLRIGDSLVQEIGGLTLNLREKTISPGMKRKLSELKREKEKYCNNEPTAKFKTAESLIHEELRIFYEIIDEQITILTKRKQTLDLEKSNANDLRLFEIEKTDKELFDENELQEISERKKQEIDAEISQLKETEKKLKEQKPFIWDIDFVEIFGDKGGFDIIIGNPPYVRQEKIAPPNKLKNEINNESKQNYKEKLLKSVQAQFPFIQNIDKRSDYYVYFYFHGLSLLNGKGTFCFITSNSWLDVGYGKELQEFLLKHVPVIAIYDNQAKRSFEHADVNTIISLFGSPDKTGKNFSFLDNIVKFVMFKRPFEEVINAENLLKIEYSDKVLATSDFRVYPKKQKELLEEALKYPEEKESLYGLKKGNELQLGEYTGNKWGGKYLRAPDIYFKILEKGKGKLVRLGDIAEVKFGIKTGANEFFYLKPVGMTVKEVVEISEKNPDALIRVKNGGGWEGEIEVRFLKPVIKSPRELKTIIVRLEDLNYLVFMCHKSKAELKETKALEYIEWGEKQGFNKRPTCRGRPKWWDLGIWGISKNILPMFENERKYCFYNFAQAYIDAALYWCYSKGINEENLNLLLNNMIIGLWKELLCRAPEGLGALQMKVYHYSEMPLPDVKLLKFNKEIFQAFIEKKIPTIFTELGFDPSKPIRGQEPNPLPDRKELDSIVFDELGLTQEERNEVYWSVCELVKNRLQKARSI
jgi:hypothetical protein